MFQKKTKGFTLIEIMLVIGFIAGALVLAFVTYPKVQAQNRANLEGQHLVTISAGVKNLFGTARNYAGITNQVLINGKVIPDDMQINGATISNVWGGVVVIGVNAGSNNLRYQISYDTVPRAECTKLVTGAGVNFLQVQVNGTDMKNALLSPPKDIDPVLTTTTCTDQNNTLLFVTN